MSNNEFSPTVLAEILTTEEKLALAIKKLRDCQEAFSYGWRNRNQPHFNFDWDNALKEVEQALTSVEPRARLTRTIELTRSWDSDMECINDNNLLFKHCLFTAWTKQVELEFKEAVESHLAVYNPIVEVVFEKSKVRAVMPSGDLEATWLVTVSFEYGDLGRSFTNDCDLIQHVFFEESCCGGSFTMVGDYTEKEEA